MSSFFLLWIVYGCKIFAVGEKKIFSTRIDEDSIDADESLGILLEEDIQNLLKKYERRLKK